MARLWEAGIATVADERAGADMYVAFRQQWEPRVSTFVDYLGHGKDGVESPESTAD